MKKLDIYIAACVSMGVGVYLHSNWVCLGGIVLWVASLTQDILTYKNKDAEVLTLMDRMAKIEKEHRMLSMDITNVAERAKTILGEQY